MQLNYKQNPLRIVKMGLFFSKPFKTAVLKTWPEKCKTWLIRWLKPNTFLAKFQLVLNYRKCFFFNFCLFCNSELQTCNVRQPDNKIWSVNRIQNERHFSWKNHTQNLVEKLVPDPFIKKSKLRSKLRSLDQKSQINLINFFFHCMLKLRSTKLY